MAETDNNQYSGSRRVNMKICGWSPQFSPTFVQIPGFTPIGTTVIELREFQKKKNMDKMGKLFFTITFIFGAL